MKILRFILLPMLIVGVVSSFSLFKSDEEKKEEEIRKQMQVDPNEDFYNVDREKIMKQVEEDRRRAKEISEQRRKERKARGEPDRLFN